MTVLVRAPSRRAIRLPNLPQLDRQREVEELPQEYAGHAVDSKEEGRIIVAAQALGMRFEYQVPFFGGTVLRGGQVLDFLFHTAPKLTPLYMLGAYWHSYGREASTVLAIHQFRSRTGHYLRKPVLVWDFEVPTVEAASRILLERVGRT